MRPEGHAYAVVVVSIGGRSITDSGEGAREMDGHAEPAAVTARRAAIQLARGRYERGELTYDAFRRALDAIVLARDSDECQAILDALPAAPLAALSALDAPMPPVPAPDVGPLESQRITAIMSQVWKMRHPWRLAVSTHALTVMGELKLDLRLADLPRHATLHVTAFMGSATIYVPRSVRVTVHTRVVMGGVRTFGDNVAGVSASGHVEYAPPLGAAAPELDIEVRCYMGDVRIILTDREPAVPIGELVRDALRAVAEGARRGLREGVRQYPSLPAGDVWREER